MSDTMQLVLILVVFKIATLGTGAFIMYMGYRLFVKGVFDPVEFEDTWKDGKLVWRKASPGIVFVLVGAGIVALALLRGLPVDLTTIHSAESDTSSSSTAPSSR